MTEGTVLRLERFAIHDGPGIRTTVFLKGCPLRCAWCHSPESQDVGPRVHAARGPLHPLRRVHRCLPATRRRAGRRRALQSRPAECTTCGDCAGVCPTRARANWSATGRRCRPWWRCSSATGSSTTSRAAASPSPAASRSCSPSSSSRRSKPAATAGIARRGGHLRPGRHRGAARRRARRRPVPVRPQDDGRGPPPRLHGRVERADPP